MTKPLLNHEGVRDPILDLVPLPAECLVSSGYLNLNEITGIVFNESGLNWSANYLQQKLEGIFPSSVDSFPTPNEINSDGGVKYKIALQITCMASDEIDYQLSIDQDSVCIKAASESGIFYGIQTFLQLAFNSLAKDNDRDVVESNEQHFLPCLEINDFARFGYRGVHLDVSRHFFSVQQVKKHIDLLAMHKMNICHLHLADDQGWRIEIKKYPKLVEVGSYRKGTVVGHSQDRAVKLDDVPHSGYYTQADIRDLVDYAGKRQITIIPEIDLPGHCSALLAAYPEYHCDPSAEGIEVKTHFGVFNNILCNKEETFSFISDILSEIAQLFPSDYIHIGGDEVKKEQWLRCHACQALMTKESLSNPDELQGYFINRVMQILESLGKKAIGWDDVLECGNVNSNITIMSWLGEENAKAALDNGHDLVMTQSDLYFDSYQSTSIDEPLAIHGHSPLKNVYLHDPAMGTEPPVKNLLGAQANVWTEYIDTSEYLEYMLLPRLTALAEILWTPKHLQDWGDFKRRLKTQFQRFDSLGINASRSHFVPKITVCELDQDGAMFNLAAEDENFEIFYSLDGTQPDRSSQLFQSPVAIKRPTVIKAVCYDSAQDKYYGVSRLSLAPHKGLAGTVTLVSPEADGQTNNLEVLTNGVLGQEQLFQDSEWASFSGFTVIELQIDLARVVEVSELSLGFSGCLGRELYWPENIELFQLTDQGADVKLANFNIERDQPANKRASLKFNPTNARSLRIKISNESLIYSNEEQKKIIKKIYIDEIVVN